MLNRAIAEAVTLQDVSERLATLGYDPVASTPDEFATQIKTDLAKVIRAAGIRTK